MRVKEYFTNAELACRCGCGVVPNEASVNRLYALRILYGKALVLTSAARCQTHNKKSNGAAGSTHLPANLRAGESSKWGGQGFDIRVSGRIEAAELEVLASLCGFRGFGYGSNFLHIDDAARPNITRWLY